MLYCRAVTQSGIIITHNCKIPSLFLCFFYVLWNVYSFLRTLRVLQVVGFLKVYKSVCLVFLLGVWYPRCSNTEMSRAVYTEQWYRVPAVENPAICTRIQWSSKESSSCTSDTLSTQSLLSAQLSPTAESQMCQFAYFIITTSTFWQAGSFYFGNLYIPLSCSLILHVALSQSSKDSRNTEVILNSPSW